LDAVRRIEAREERGDVHSGSVLFTDFFGLELSLLEAANRFIMPLLLLVGIVARDV